jgi:thiamine biosynthesis lipoprotein
MQYSQKSIHGNTLFYSWFQAMHTRVDVLLYAENSLEQLKSLSEKIKIEIERFEKLANRFNENSELSQLNSKAFKNAIPISTELFQIIGECLEFNKKTFGYFDITINSKHQFTNGISNLDLSKENQTIRFSHPDVQLDLSGFIKGYALRFIKSMLYDEKIDDALVNIGNSSVLAIGNHPHGKGWKVNSNQQETSRECVLQNQCLTTSGNTNNTKWPIQKPMTRKVIENCPMLSVITEDPAIGEVLSKALYIANEQEKLEILNVLKGQIIHFN